MLAHPLMATVQQWAYSSLAGYETKRVVASPTSSSAQILNAIRAGDEVGLAN